MLPALFLCLASLVLAGQGPRETFVDGSDTVRSSSANKLPPLFYPTITSELVSQASLLSVFRSSSATAILYRESLVRSIDSLYKIRLIGEPYHVALLKRLIQSSTPSASTRSDTTGTATTYFLDALLATAFDLFRGYKAASYVGYDKVGLSYQHRDDSIIKAGILAMTTPEQLRRWLFSLEPSQSTYVRLKKAYIDRQPLESGALRSTLNDTLIKMRHSLHLYRWLFHFKLDRFLLVNIASARAYYVEKDQFLISMRTIVGKPSTPTPRFTSYCHRLILYPYWYVPSSIAVGEYLSKIKRDPRWLDQRNMQVIDAKGSVVDHHRLHWSQFSAAYFPYTIRQSTGCDNALGVLKFDIETPYWVYLHDTNHKPAFLQASRFLSHGCIRLEEPLLLGSKLLSGELDTAYLQSCFADKSLSFAPCRNRWRSFVFICRPISTKGVN
ncbi:MAG: L,D-transpeptidase family protein [Sphingomonadales bacterium]